MSVPAFKINKDTEQIEEKRQEKPKLTTNHNGSDVLLNIENCLLQLEENNISIANDYSTEYLVLAFAFASLGEPGRSYFHRVCSLWEKYNYKDANDKFTEAIKNGKGAYTIASFFEMCKDVGVFHTPKELTKNNVEKANKPTEGSISKILQFNDLLSYRFDDKNQIPKPIAVVTIEDSVICTPGNISVIAGPSKSGKSGGAGALLAGAIRSEGQVLTEEDTIGFSVASNEHRKGVIHIDSEQSRFDHQRFNNQVLKRSGRTSSPDHYYSFSLQRFTPEELRKAIETIFKEVAKRHNGLHMAVVDGVGDCVSSVNDELESNAVVLLFIRLATEYNIPIILILHFNPGSEKGRGHIGSHLERKCESFLSFEKNSDKDLSIIKPKLLRNAGSFDEIQFEFNRDKGYHTLVAKVNRAEIQQEKKALKLVSKKEQYNAILDEVFRGKDKVRNRDIIAALKDYFDIKDRGAENRKEEIVSMGLIQLQGTFYIRNKEAL